MATRIQPKRSTTPNSKPQVADLRSNEIALNIPDRKLFINNNGTVEELLNGAPNDETIITSMFVQSITDGVGNTWFVSKNGTDKAQVGGNNPLNTAAQNTNQWGATEGTAFATIKYAMTYAQSGDVIEVSAGEYEEIFPLQIPAGVAVRGSGQKNTFIKPTTGTNQLDCFQMIGDCMIEDLTVKDYFYNSSNDTGYAFKLKNNYNVATEGRRPYIKGVSVITKGSVTSASDPRGFNQGDAGRGALIDGSVVSTSSSEATLLFNEVTFIVPNSRGLYLKNGARAEWLNSFTYFAQDSIVGENPGGTGFAGQGKIRLKLNGITGTFNVGNTITLRNSGGTIIAQGTISGNDGTYITIDGQGTGEFVEAAASTDGKSITVNGDTQLSTTEKKFGTASVLFDGTGDDLSLATSSDFGFGTGDFAVEAFIRPTAITVLDTIFDFRTASPEVALAISINSSGQIVVNVNGSNVITGGSISINTWAHIAVSRVSGTTSLFVNGSRVGSAYTDSNNYGNTKPLTIGRSGVDGGNAFAGYVDEIRISKGAARYANAASITVPTAAFVADVNTSLLIHADGLSGSTQILDGGITSQDIQSSSGGVAQFITLADYTDFGAELRSIGSASVYGTRGITADGKGVRLRCIVHNFGYVGLGADQSNDISNVIQANEVIEQNSGRALFTSMDQNGDFRVGNAFFVDQERGTVSFAGGDSGGTTFDQLTVSGSGNTTTILPTQITVGNLGFSGDQIINNTTNGIELGSTLELLDGTSADPSLTFINDNDSGIFRDTDYVEYTINDANEETTTPIGNPWALGFKDARKLQIGRINWSLVNLAVAASNIGTITNVSFGNNYAPGQHSSPVSGGAGTGATLNYEIWPFTVNITNKGSGYTPGTTQQEDVVTNSGNGNGGKINVEIHGIETATLNGGSGYYTGDLGTGHTFGNIPFQGGNGTTGAASLEVDANGVIVTVTITQHGTGYNNGDVLTVNNSDLIYTNNQGGESTSGGAGFSWTLTEQPGSVKSITPEMNPWDGKFYRVNDVISFNDSVASGSNFSATVTAVGVPQTATLGSAGEGYNVGDRLNPTFVIDTTDPVGGAQWNESAQGIFNYITYNVKVESGTTHGGNSYFIDKLDGNGWVEHPDLTLERGYAYSFVFTDGNAMAHPFHWSTTEDGTHGGGTRYQTNIRKHWDANGVEDGSQIFVTDVTPATLHYYCEQHPNMGGPSGQRNQVTMSGTWGTGLAVDVATLSRNKKVEIFTDGSAKYDGRITSSGLTATQNVQIESGGNLVTIPAAGPVGGDITCGGNLTVAGNATVDGDLLIKGTSEFSATVGGAGEVAIGDVNADTVNIKGDVLFNPVYGTPTPPATVGTLESAQLFLDFSEAKFGFFEHEPKSEVDITGRLHNTGDAFLASTQGETLHIGRDQETYTAAPGIVLDVAGDTITTGHVAVPDGVEGDPQFRFTSNPKVGLFAHNISGNEYGISFNNDSGRTVEINSGENKFYRNTDWIKESVGTTTLTSGTGYTNGIYTNITGIGGSGNGIKFNLTVAFGTTISNPGVGYTDAIYTGVTLTSVTGATAGALQTLNITTAGNDYVSGTYTNVALNGGNGSNATVDVIVSGGGITSIVPNTVGSGYQASDAVSVNVADIGGSQLSNNFTISAGGSGYTDGNYLNIPFVNSSGSGTNGRGNVTVSGGAVTAVTVQTGGGGYTTSDVLTFDGDDLTIAVINTLSIAVAGSGYANGNYTNVSLSGGNGAGATADIVVSGNAVTSATISTNGGGTNYLVGDTLTFASSAVGGTGAGLIDTLTISAAGTGFTDGNYTGVALSGGSGSNGTIDIEVSGGQITAATINNKGTGYAIGNVLSIAGYAGASVTVATLASPVAGSLSVATITVGSGAQVTPATVITGTGSVLEVGTVASGSGGNGAAVDLVVSGGQVTSAIVANAGTGFSIGDTIRVNDSDMTYDDGTGSIVQSAVPTTQMLLTIDGLGQVTKATIPTTGEGEGYKLADEITVNASDIGSGGNGFKITVGSINTETTVSINEREGSLTVKQFDAQTLTIDNSLALTGTGINKQTADNFLLTALTNSFVEITGQQAFIVPRGNSAQRPTGVAGMIRYNSEVSQFEGYNGTSFVSLGGVRDVDLDTYITAENTTNADDDTFRFYNENVNTIKLTKDVFSLNNADLIEYTDLNNVALWVEGTAVISPFDASTFDGSSASIVDVNAETITLTGHNLTQGVIVTYSNGGGSDIGGLANGVDYHVEVVDANTIKLASDSADLANDNFVNIGPVGTGTSHTFTPTTASVVDILYYYGDNVYAVTGSGTFDASASNFPSHTTGAVANGTAQLTWRRTRYANPVFRAKDVDYQIETFNINTANLKFSSTSTNAYIGSNIDSIDFGFDNTGDKVLFGATKTGGLFVNTGYVAGTTSNTEILNYELNEFTLKDTKVLSADATLDTSVGNSVSLTFKPYTEGFSGKFMVEIKDNSATPKRQFSEISFLCVSDGSAIIYTEVSKIYTDVVLCDVSVDIVGNNITLIVQDSQNSSTVVYTVKAIHNSILA